MNNQRTAQQAAVASPGAEYSGFRGLETQRTVNDSRTQGE